MAHTDSLLLSLFLSLLLIATVVVASAPAEQQCVYTFKIKTGTRDSSGTDSIIGASISDKSGQHIDIGDLEKWGGVMGQGHNYYENGNLDIFSGTAPCLPSPVCFLNLNSDGSGNKPGWYVKYVEVKTTRPGVETKRQYFDVEQWLAVDEPPHELSVERNNCLQTVSTSVGVGCENRKCISSII
ncbi:hypothetical protein Rs2_31447 [Raphanus sativus]|uniref:PLAT domain-containing protein 2-like n=1 Tax=Raphanus sativus TaxID=3726 RepID=A0A9W3C0Z7_RAPSA|nr:PLAT domain-containing protein 2-like [Raphanus sativus]KAJ4891699.1 hypothetical protein Rs2_31447 [Raphanus sativus]